MGASRRAPSIRRRSAPSAPRSPPVPSPRRARALRRRARAGSGPVAPQTRARRRAASGRAGPRSRSRRRSGALVRRARVRRRQDRSAGIRADPLRSRGSRDASRHRARGRWRAARPSPAPRSHPTRSARPRSSARAFARTVGAASRSGGMMRISVLGVGRLGASHAAMLATLPGVSQLTVYDADPARAKDVAAPLKARAVGTIDEAFKDAEAMVIVTPTDTHAPLIKRAIDQGLPTFCEKPIAIGIPETRDIVDHVERKNGRLQIGFQRRFDAGYQRARSELESGRLGAVYSFLMVSCDRLPPPDGYIKTSGGQFKDQFIHDFDITRWLFDQEVAEVTAIGSTKGVPQYEAMGDVGTSAVMLKLADGTLGLMTALRHNEAGYDIH